MSGFADTFSVYKDLEFFITNASICDTSGELLMYSNGIYIANKNHDTLQNSGSFNPGYSTEFYGSDGLGISQAILFIPRPQHDSLIQAFHVSADIADSQNVQPLQFRMSEINMMLDNGLGGILEDKKGISLIEDTLVFGRITGCKHANGRDWWIITHRWNSDLYYKFLLTPDTIVGPFEQNIGSIVDKQDAYGQSCFSPDGSKFAMVHRNYNFDYMEFDRCSGEFFNDVNILLPDSNLSQGICFSANSRFLYCNTYTQLFQFDTWANDLGASRILVDTLPFSQPGIPDWFAAEMLAPDGKIYLSTYNGVKAMHLINAPDSLGLASGFIRQGLPLPMYNAYAIPNHPNYDLGPLQGSPCDTLFLSTPLSTIENWSFQIYPNPVNDWLNVTYKTTEFALLELFDTNSKRLGSVSLYPYFKNRLLDVRELPMGLYLVTVSQKGERIWGEKVVVAR